MSKTPRDPKGEKTEERMAKLEKALAEALARSEAVDELLVDQQQRLKSLGLGREETMRALKEVRDELRRVSQERDELRKQLSRIDAVQTATLALPDDEAVPPAGITALPSLDDLMAALGDIKTPRGSADGILHQKVEPLSETPEPGTPEPGTPEPETPRRRATDRSDRPNPQDRPVGSDRSDRPEPMISPELVFPEEYAATAEPADAKDTKTTRILVLLDAEHPVKYPLYKEVLTIGRAEIADIRINNGFLSRLHARVVTTADRVFIEDVESKNGIRVNAKLTPRQELKHGDVVDLGRLRFRFIDTATGDE